MDKAVSMIAIQLRWPPGSWDDLPLTRILRLVNAASELARDRRLPFIE